MKDKNNLILVIAYSLHTNYENDRVAFHVACYGITDKCPICGEEISK